jgi:hypothetical protein
VDALRILCKYIKVDETPGQTALYKERFIYVLLPYSLAQSTISHLMRIYRWRGVLEELRMSSGKLIESRTVISSVFGFPAAKHYARNFYHSLGW